MNKLIEESFQTYNGDAFKVIVEFETKGIKVDHIITDPPFNISQKNNLHTMRGKRAGVDFGDWDWDFDLTGWIPEYANLLEPGGSMIVFNSFRNISYIADAMEQSGLVVKDILKWIKTNPMPRNIDRRYVQDTEFAVWAVKPKGKWVFNKRSDKKYERAEFHTAVVAGKERTSHPTQKSIQLMTEIIEIHTNEGDIVMDPFMGSGTTGVAALGMNRKFIGVELSPEYYELANRRLSDEQNEIKLFT
jgi:DNA modification methylase